MPSEHHRQNQGSGSDDLGKAPQTSCPRPLTNEGLQEGGWGNWPLWVCETFQCQYCGRLDVPVVHWLQTMSIASQGACGRDQRVRARERCRDLKGGHPAVMAEQAIAQVILES